MASRKQVKPKQKPHPVATKDFYGNAVHCTAPQWESHIIDPIDGHPEMDGREAEVRKTVEDPDYIRPSTTTGLAFAYEKITSIDTVRVIVYYENPALVKMGATTGKIATAYPDDPNVTSQVGHPIYTKHPKKTGGNK
jgi:hypothetical protein